MANPRSDQRRSPTAAPEGEPVIRVLPPEEREAAIARLSAAFAHDVLPLEEFERRVAEAYRAATPAALAVLVEDLPAGIAPAEAERARAVEPVRPIVDRVTAIFGSVERSERVAVPARVELRAVFGNVELDWREAEFAPGITEISVKALFGNVEVRLPAHVVVENHGGSVLGSFAARARRHGRTPGDDAARPAAIVRITGRAVLGNVEFESGAEKGH